MINEELLQNIKKEALASNVPILQDESLKVIMLLLKLVNPKRILEIGTAVGYSAINFSKVLADNEDAYIKTIEIREDMYNVAKKNISEMKLEHKIKVINEDATKYLPNLKEENMYDVVFIDAAKGQYLLFLENAIRLVKNGGIIIADNVLFKGRVLSDYNEHKYRTAVNRLRTYLKVIEEDARLESTLLNVGDGLAISIVNKMSNI